MKRSTAYALFFALAALESAAASAYLISIPSDPKNSLIWGFSAARLALLGLQLVLAGGCAGLGLWFYRRPGVAQALHARISAPSSSGALFAAVLALFTACWILDWTPLYRFREWGAYIERFAPLRLWLTLVCLQALFGLALIKGWLRPKMLAELAGHERRLLRAALLALAAFLLLWGFIALSRVGLTPDRYFWNQNGIPILPQQVLAAWAVSAALLWASVQPFFGRLYPLFGHLHPLFGGRKWLDPALFLAIWLAAAVLWTHAGVSKNFFAAQPIAPNAEAYPFSDAVTYDTIAQFALTGLGYDQFHVVDKPLYAFLLLIFNFFGGHSYTQVMLIQAAVFAIFPALLYLLGHELHSRPAGLLIAGLAAFKETNAYQAVTVQTTHSQLAMSESVTGIALVILTLCVVKWTARRDLRWAMAAGGTLGLATLLRHNTWLLLPAALAFALPTCWKAWKLWLAAGLMFTLMVFASSAPWMLREISLGHPPLSALSGALNGVVLKNRFSIGEVRTAARPTLVPASGQPPASSPTPAPAAQPVPGSSTFARLAQALEAVTPHFFHNIVTTGAVLPLQGQLNDLAHTLDTPGNIWREDWAGQLPPQQAAFLVLNLVVVSIGIGAAWRRLRLAGLAPLYLYLAYLLALAAARTSGGRYIVPIDWVVYAYYALGLIQLAEWLLQISRLGSQEPLAWSPDSVQSLQSPRGAQPSQMAGRSAGWRGYFGVLVLFVAIGALLPLSERIIPARYPLAAAAQLKAQYTQQASLLANTGNALQLMNTPGAIILQGRALYPRFYRMNEGEPSRETFLLVRDFPRMTFTLIGPQGRTNVILPTMISPGVFPQASDVIVVGCTSKGYFDAAAVLLQAAPQGSLLYTRSPSAPPVCPLPKPQCDENHHCQ